MLSFPDTLLWFYLHNYPYIDPPPSFLLFYSLSICPAPSYPLPTQPLSNLAKQLMAVIPSHEQVP